MSRNSDVARRDPGTKRSETPRNSAVQRLELDRPKFRVVRDFRDGVKKCLDPTWRRRCHNPLSRAVLSLIVRCRCCGRQSRQTKATAWCPQGISGRCVWRPISLVRPKWSRQQMTSRKPERRDVECHDYRLPQLWWTVKLQGNLRCNGLLPLPPRCRAIIKIAARNNTASPRRRRAEIERPLLNAR